MAQPIATDTVDYNVVYRFFSWFGNKIKDTFNAAVDTVKGWLGVADDVPAIAESTPEVLTLPESAPDAFPGGAESIPDSLAATEVAGSVVETEWPAGHDMML